MSETPDDARADPGRVIADLRRRLAVRTAERDQARAERDAAVEQQTATADVLQVINSSPGDLAPVFDAMLQKALSLCGAAFGQLVTFDGVVFRAAAWRGYEPGPSATAPTPGMALHQLVDGEQIVHIPDITADDVYRSGNAVRRRLADEYGGRTAIWVALRKDRALLGAFVIYRTEIRPFTDKEIALLENFAAQAVIAIENARLLDELRQRTCDRAFAGVPGNGRNAPESGRSPHRDPTASSHPNPTLIGEVQGCMGTFPWGVLISYVAPVRLSAPTRSG